GCVERGDGPAHGDAHELVAALPRELAEAVALGADHEDTAVRRGLDRVERGLAFAREAEDLEALVVERLEGAREVDHAGDRGVLDGASGGAAHHARDAGAPPRGEDDAVGAERDGAADDGAEVVRIGDLVERDEERALGRAGEELLQREVGELGRERDHPLVAESLGELVELLTAHELDADRERARELDDAGVTSLVAAEDVDHLERLGIVTIERFEDEPRAGEDALHERAPWISATTARAAATRSSAARMGRPTTS